MASGSERRAPFSTSTSGKTNSPSVELPEDTLRRGQEANHGAVPPPRPHADDVERRSHGSGRQRRACWPSASESGPKANVHCRTSSSSLKLEPRRRRHVVVIESRIWNEGSASGMDTDEEVIT